jgi:acetyl-CoA synthetase
MSPSLHRIPADFARGARIGQRDYQRMYAESLENPEKFWGAIGLRLDWIKNFSRVKDSSFDPSGVHIRWYYDGTLNVASNCLDRHLESRGDKTAIIWSPMILRGPNPSATVNSTSASANAPAP